MLYIFSIYTKTIAVSIPNIAPNKTSFGVWPFLAYNLLTIFTINASSTAIR